MRVHKSIGKQIGIMVTKLNKLVAKFDEKTQDAVREHTLMQNYLAETQARTQEKHDTEMLEIAKIRDKMEINIKGIE